MGMRIVLNIAGIPTLSFFLPFLFSSSFFTSLFYFPWLGALIIAIVGGLERIKFRYLQTYLIYSAVRGGFCSALTTFGNLIEDTGRLILNGIKKYIFFFCFCLSFFIIIIIFTILSFTFLWLNII